jgi:hypothetical protein
VIQLCSGLAYAHAEGFVHGDVKPSNILVLGSGPVKIVDFGLAQVRQMARASASFAGTPSYMSPEQLTGLMADERSDVWSAGVTLYELLNYRLPFVGGDLGTLIKSVLNNPLPPLNSSIPLATHLDQILERALAKDRNARYPTADALAHDLLALLSLADRDRPVHCVVDNRELITDENPGLKSSNAPSPRLKHGFNNLAAGGFRFRVAHFTSSGGLERLKQLLNGTDTDTLLAWLSVPFLSSVVLSLSLSLRAARAPVASAISLFLWILAIAFSDFITFPSTVAVRRRCQTCSRSMARVSNTSRFVSSTSEKGWGISDCIAALQEGQYEDAAKLLRSHGSETALVYTVTRYSLELWECVRCTDQTAVLLVEHRIASRWRRDDRYFESYKFGGRGVSSPSTCSADPPLAAEMRTRCPVCGLGPPTRLLCSCGHVSNFVGTGGVCPNCSRYAIVKCPSCEQASAYIDWYGI